MIPCLVAMIAVIQRWIHYEELNKNGKHCSLKEIIIISNIKKMTEVNAVKANVSETAKTQQFTTFQLLLFIVRTFADKKTQSKIYDSFASLMSGERKSY